MPASALVEGCDVERAVELNQDEAYGPAAICAYHLESSFAEYPRVVVGEGVVKYLEYLEHLPQTSSTNVGTLDVARSCRELLCKAPDDGRVMLHMLSPAILGLGPAWSEPAQSAYEWAKEELRAHRVSGDTKLEDRYRRLLLYFGQSGFTG